MAWLEAEMLFECWGDLLGRLSACGRDCADAWRDEAETAKTEGLILIHREGIWLQGSEAVVRVTCFGSCCRYLLLVAVAECLHRDVLSSAVHVLSTIINVLYIKTITSIEKKKLLKY
jgi:hypothetical protein